MRGEVRGDVPDKSSVCRPGHPTGRAMTGSKTTKGIGSVSRRRRAQPVPSGVEDGPPIPEGEAALAAARMSAAAAKLGHVLGFLAVFRTVFAEFTVGWDRAGTTRMSALLRLIHNAPCSQILSERLSHSTGRPARPTGCQREGGAGACGSGLFGGGRCAASIHFTLGSEDAAPVLVLRDGHSAFDADSDALPGLGIAGKQFFQK